ncbi:type II toxin-antitoxin system Phd/YefM family antitoxin [Leucobacter coleopterorum]|nr:type II toxin-antitoxin system Phd/YefM family antitoxin [Leucobacter coleopterorum]
MTVLSLADARASLSRIVKSASTTHERFEVTRNGRRVAVLLGADDYDALLETIDILSNPREIELIYEGITDFNTDNVSSPRKFVRLSLLECDFLHESNP